MHKIDGSWLGRGDKSREVCEYASKVYEGGYGGSGAAAHEDEEGGDEFECGGVELSG